MLAGLYKILGSTEIKTQIAVLKFQSAYHFTIPPIKGITKIGFKTMLAEPNGLAFNFLTSRPFNRKELKINCLLI